MASQPSSVRSGLFSGFGLMLAKSLITTGRHRFPDRFRRRRIREPFVAVDRSTELIMRLVHPHPVKIVDHNVLRHLVPPPPQPPHGVAAMPRLGDEELAHRAELVVDVVRDVLVAGLGRVHGSADHLARKPDPDRHQRSSNDRMSTAAPNTKLAPNTPTNTAFWS